MAKSKINELEWNSLLIPDDLSSEEEESHSSIITQYLSKRTNDQSVDISTIDQTVEIDVDDSLLESEELELETITNDELFNYFQEEKIENDPNILFPKTENINVLFWFLHNFGKLDISKTKIVINNREELSIIFYRIIEAAIFFGFLKRVETDEATYLIPTDVYEDFMGKTIEMQYPIFLASLGHNEAISEALQIQLNDPIYDSISRQMVHNILVNDPNIKQESLSNDEVTSIVNSLRYWYLAIKQTILED